jgi:WhiB family redox-sensing transcriptional regulator
MGRQPSRQIEIPKFILEGDAACSQTDPEIFFPMEIEDSSGNIISSTYAHLKAAKEICSSCPLVTSCLAYALKHDELGVWGGTTESQRKYMKRYAGVRALISGRTRVVR